MDDLRAVVKDAAQAMAAKVADHAIAVLFGMALDHRADVTQMIAGLGLFDAQHQAFIGYLDQAARLDRRFARDEHAAGVAMPAIDQRGDVDIDDVAILEPIVAGDAMADDIVDRCAAAMGIAAIAQGRGHAAAVERHAPDDVVQFAGRDAGHDMRYQRVEYLGGEPSGLAHASKTGCVIEFDRSRAGDRRIRRHRHIFGHGMTIGADAR